MLRQDRGVKILLVDPSAALRARLHALIADLLDGASPDDGDGGSRLRIDHAGDPASALRLHEASPAQLVVIDPHLPAPGENVRVSHAGLSTIESLRSSPASPWIVVLTNEATEPYRRECLARGADYFFDKSADLHSALDAMAELAVRPRRKLGDGHG